MLVISPSHTATPRSVSRFKNTHTHTQDAILRLFFSPWWEGGKKPSNWLCCNLQEKKNPLFLFSLGTKREENYFRFHKQKKLCEKLGNSKMDQLKITFFTRIKCFFSSFFLSISFSICLISTLGRRSRGLRMAFSSLLSTTTTVVTDKKS